MLPVLLLCAADRYMGRCCRCNGLVCVCVCVFTCMLPVLLLCAADRYMGRCRRRNGLVCVQVIMATNRADTLDPALLRPGRLDRKIEFPMPDRRQKRLIFATITGKMNLSEDVDLEDYVARPDRISGADINAICQEVSQ